MKHLIISAVLVIISSLSHAQTGGMRCHVDFVNDVQCVTFNVELRKADTVLTYQMVGKGDTITGIPEGMYDVTFLSCDSAYSYSQRLEIVEDQIRSFYYRNQANLDQWWPSNGPYTDEYYQNYYDSLYTPSFINVSWQFSRGIDYNGLNPNLLNNFAFDYIVGQDFLLTKPIALGYEIGFGYTQANYTTDDFLDSQISYDKQRFTTFDISFALVSSVYVRNGKMLSLGARYRLPYFARWARVNGDQKISTRGLHKYNDFSVFAQLGYEWGFLFAEYRFDQILRSPMGDLPNLSLGVRLSIAQEW